MNKKPKYKIWFCKYCGTEEMVKDNEDKIKLEEITEVYCPVCSTKGHKRKMLKVITDEKKN